jgi:hypothetical protein
LTDRDLQLPQWWSDNGVSELLAPVGAVVPVLGAGVRGGAGLPDAAQLAAWLADRAPMTEAPSDRTELFSVVDAVDPAQLPTVELQQLVATYIETIPLRPTPFIEELVHLPARFIVTLNYDDLVASAAEQQGLKVCRLSALARHERLEAHRRLSLGRRGQRPS